MLLMASHPGFWRITKSKETIFSNLAKRKEKRDEEIFPDLLDLFLSLIIWEKASVQETLAKGRETIWEVMEPTFWQSYSNHNQSDL